MRKILLMLFILSLFIGCKKDDEQYFKTMVDVNSISFKPVKGGSIMSYNIPESESIYGIQVTYSSATGEKMTVIGSYGSTELLLSGFFDEEKDIPARVSYINRSHQISKSIEVTFSTLESVTVSIFKDMKVTPYWNGFNVEFEAPEDAAGVVNIGYMGISPTTGKYDIIIKDTKVINAGVNKLSYSDIANSSEDLEVVVWSEDFSQNLGKRATYTIIPKVTKMMDNSKLTYSGDSYEYDNYPYRVSWKYLFDGDKTCINQMNKKDGDYLFITKQAVDRKPSGIIDLQESKVLAFLRYYTPLNLIQRYGASSIGAEDGGLPNHFKLYASNDKDAPPAQWVQIGEYYQSRTLDEAFWWCFPQLDPSREYKILEDIESAKPCYIDVKFDITEAKYRYIKIEFLDIFREGYKRNAMCNEIEVFVGE